MNCQLTTLRIYTQSNEEGNRPKFTLSTCPQETNHAKTAIIIPKLPIQR